MERAFALANHWHMNLVRKNTKIPYISHLMAVSALVLEYGGTPTQASAALLHDVIEDTDCTIDEVIELVGDEVAQIVLECTHIEFAEITDKEAKTVAKKTFYLERLLSPIAWPQRTWWRCATKCTTLNAPCATGMRSSMISQRCSSDSMQGGIYNCGGIPRSQMHLTNWTCQLICEIAFALRSPPFLEVLNESFTATSISS